MVYGRRYAGRELRFEASGALLHASLVMRDRETQSYWSILRGEAIGGELQGTRLEQLAVGETLRFGDWLSRHPETLVLSVDGREHVAQDPYAGYLESERTFRDRPLGDRRLAAKALVLGFFLSSKAYAVAHASLAGGRVLRLESGARVLVYRAVSGSSRASSRAFQIAARDTRGDAAILADFAAGDLAGLAPLPGSDAYWYTWVLSNPDTALLR